jgi:hypothetical protein
VVAVIETKGNCFVYIFIFCVMIFPPNVEEIMIG